jgi:hypothetical protein
MNICVECGKEFDPVLYIDGKRVAKKKTRKKCFECDPYKPQVIRTKTSVCEICNKEFYPVIYYQGKRLWRRGRHYCFDCVPYTPSRKGASFTKTRNTIDNKRQCRICKEYKELTEFSPTNKIGNLNSYCKKCAAKRKKKPQQRFKEECIAYKGGKCVICSYNKCPAALEFHHRNPDEKDFTISHLSTVILSDEVKNELDKCDLLCSNCHREKHYFGI